MKKLYNIILSVLAVTFLFSACNVKDFGDINKDPNNPSTAFTNYLFTEACTYVPRFVLGNADNGYDPWQQEWTGYISESKNNQYGPLSTTVQWSDVGGVYLYALRNLNQIIEMNEDPASRIGRPRQIYIGEAEREVKPLGERQKCVVCHPE